MFETLFGAEMPLAVRFSLAFLLVLALIGGAAWGVRKIGAPPPPPPPPPPTVRIARIVDDLTPGLGGSTRRVSVVYGVLMTILIIFSLVSATSYYTAETVFQQIAALLMWIGNGVFWGVIMIVTAVLQPRTYIVYREEQKFDVNVGKFMHDISTERQEPYPGQP